MIDLWGNLGRLVHDPVLLTDVRTLVNGRISPIRLHVGRDVVKDVRAFLEPKAGTPFITNYTAGEVARWCVQEDIRIKLASIKSTQTGLPTWGALNVATLPPEFFQVLGLIVIDPVSRVDAAGSIFPPFCSTLTGPMKANLTELANNNDFQTFGSGFVKVLWEEIACLGRAKFYDQYLHPDA